MTMILSPPVRRNEEDDIVRSRYRCLNENCRYINWLSRARRKLCPKCYAHTEIIDVKRIPAKTK